MAWETAERVQKNAQGQYRALIGGEWVPVEKAQKNTQGAFRVERKMTAPAEAAGEEMRSPGQELWRQLKLSLRAPIEAVGGLADVVASPVTVPINALAGRQVIPTQSGKAVADTFLPKPETPEEQLVGRTAAAGYEAMLPMGAAAQGVKQASGAAKEVLKLLADKPLSQVLLASLGGASGEMVRQEGGSGMEQAGAAIGAPVAAALLAHPTKTLGRTLGGIVTAPSKSGAKRAAGRIAVDAARERAPHVVQAIRNGAVPETAAQAAVPAGSAEFAGLEQLVRSRKPSEFGPAGAIAQGADAWRKGQLDTLNSLEDGIRSQLLQQANDTGMDIADLSMKVGQLKATPGYKTTTMQGVLNWLDKELVKRSETYTGDINAIDLNGLRRDLGKHIAQKVADPKKPWDKAEAAKILREFQLDIDHKLESAIGNDRWTRELMKPSSEFRGNLSDIRQRVLDAETMGAAGQQEARRITHLDETPVSLPNLLSRPMMAVNALLRFAQGKGGEKTSRTLAELMQPQEKMGLAQLMEEEIARRAKRTNWPTLMGRAAVQGGLQSTQVIDN